MVLWMPRESIAVSLAVIAACTTAAYLASAGVRGRDEHQLKTVLLLRDNGRQTISLGFAD